MPKHVTAAKPRLRGQAGITAGIPITIEQPHNCGREQQAVIAAIAGALSEGLGCQVNYDHVKLTIPRAPVPIHYRKHRYDVSTIVRDRVILIDVSSVDVRYFQRGDGKIHVESEVETI